MVRYFSIAELIDHKVQYPDGIFRVIKFIEQMQVKICIYFSELCIYIFSLNSFDCVIERKCCSKTFKNVLILIFYFYNKIGIPMLACILYITVY